MWLSWFSEFKLVSIRFKLVVIRFKLVAKLVTKVIFVPDTPLRNNAVTCFLWYCTGGVLSSVSLDIKIYPPDPNGRHLLAFDCMNN